MASTGERSIRVIVAMLLALAATAAITAAHVPTQPAAAQDCASLIRRVTAGSGPAVRVVGDSYTQGYGVTPDETWPTYLSHGRRLIVDGYGGSGFVASPCPHGTFADRVSGPASLVVIQGGLNDWQATSPQVARGLRRAVAAAEAPVVVVGPTAAPDRPGQARRVDRVLARAAAPAGARYVSMIGLDLPYLADRLHLTAAGHRRFGRYVARAIEGQP